MLNEPAAPILPGPGPGPTAEAAAERGGEVAGHAAEQVKEVASQAKEQVRTLASEAKDHARSVVADATDQLRSQGDQQAKRAAGSLRSTSDGLRALAEGRTEDAGQAGQWAAQLADQLQGMAERVEQGGVEGVLRDVGGFARRRPGLFLVGALAAGFAVGRMVKNAGDGAGPDQEPAYDLAGGPGPDEALLGPGRV